MTNAELQPETEDTMLTRRILERGASGARPFYLRHIGPQGPDLQEMLGSIGMRSLEELCQKTVPASISISRPLSLPPATSEADVFRELKEIAAQNEVFTSFIGQGYYDCFTPPVIQRNILENPGWYTQYTPYQAEISQGRLEALVNFQTMITDLTGLDIANASLLDEGTAAAEAMMLAFRVRGANDRRVFLLSDGCHEHVRDVVLTRAEPLGIEVRLVPDIQLKFDSNIFAALVSYPKSDGDIASYESTAQAAHSAGALLLVSADLLSLAILRPPGEWGADVVIGSSQRFGVPLGFGGPHAAYFATRDEFRRELPGRLVGVSKDAQGQVAYRLALQTREQHIRRDKATSNICTAQVLLAVMAGMYGVYHGPSGLRRIADDIHQRTMALAAALTAAGLPPKHKQFFDTLRIEISRQEAESIRTRLKNAKINVRWLSETEIGISVDEAKSCDDIDALFAAITGKGSVFGDAAAKARPALSEVITRSNLRTSTFLAHPVFHRYQSETELLRYIRRLESRDLSLTTSMIPLGSCTMKLNAAAEMLAITWPEFSRLHPFAPAEQCKGYRLLTSDLEAMLAEVTGLPGVSLQPNAGSQGEYAGLLVIRAYHRARSESGRDVCLIPNSAHGTNPASAMMAGLKVIAVACDESGNVDLNDLRTKAAEHASRLCCLMVTYPSTHGVFEEGITEICEIVHKHQGLVYMDGANLNAQLGLCRPGDFGVDVCHLNLHKTFCIPHGGGGPGIGPIAVRKDLIEFLPGDFRGVVGGRRAIGAVSSAPWGSAGILPIPWVYIRLMGADGLKRATQTAILNANYIAKRLEGHFEVLYRGKNQTVAHECILDLRHLKRQIGIEAADIAKRLMDYGFHAPTVSFPVVETLMVEPTESESKQELDRFCDAMIGIKREIDAVVSGRADKTQNVLKNAPHTAKMLTSDSWPYPYTRQEAGYPAPWLQEHKFFPAVARIDNAYGDRNLFCSCVPMDAL